MFVCAECGQRYERGGYCAADGRPLAETDDPLLGTDVGRYRIAALIGEGGMGHVYLAVQPAIGSRVAIKILSDQCARQPDLLDRFFAEARAVNLIRHECIVKVIDMSKLDDGRPYIVMEYIAGQTLGPLVREGRAPLGGIVQAMSEVLSALAAAHAIGIVHRDLKPDNIIVTAEGHAKVLDFGIAKLAPGLSQLSPRTRTGALLGTPTYMAPEQISGAGAVDARTDIYAAGIVLYEAVTGRVPFEGETLFDLMRQHLEEPPPSPARLRRDLPAAFEQVILTALAKSPAERFQSADAMAEALNHAASTLPPEQWRGLSRGGVITGGPRSITRVRVTPVPTPTSPPPAITVKASPRSLKPPRRRLGFAIAILVTAVVATGITLLASSTSAPITESPIELPSDPIIVEGGGATASSPVTPQVHHGSNPRGHAVTKPQASRKLPKPNHRALDFDPKRFDPIAYLPKARALARQIYSDADFTELELYENVSPDGNVDLTLPTSSTSYYEFRSPSHSIWPADRDPEDELGCYVMVDVTATGVSARVREDDECDHAIRKVPRCSLAGVWKLAQPSPAARAVATIGFLSDGKWFFDLDHSNVVPGSSIRTFADCR